MNTSIDFIRARCLPVLRHARTMLVAGILTGLGIGGCAAGAPYNPDGLDNAGLARVADICHDVLGLSPSEPLVAGPWTGIGAHELDSFSNHYQGCVASLSDTLHQAAMSQQTHAAQESCSATGLTTDSPGLALCVLRTVNGEPDPTPQSIASAKPVSAEVTITATPFYSASPHETARREQVACAALGLIPGSGTFDGCVKQLDATFFALDNPVR